MTYLVELQEQVKELKKQVEQMKCCHNCKHLSKDRDGYISCMVIDHINYSLSQILKDRMRLFSGDMVCEGKLWKINNSLKNDSNKH